MKTESTPNLLENLRDFLSTDTRKRLFYYYVFTKTSPSDLAEATNTPISTVDMVTNSLRLMELLKEVDGEDSNKNYYEIDMDIWLMENLRSMGFGFIDKEQKYDILKILADRKFLALSFVLTNPDFAMMLYKKPLKMGDNLIVFKLMRLFTSASMVADMLSYILMSTLVFPSFKQLKENIATEKGLIETVQLIGKENAKHPFLASVLKDLDTKAFEEYGKKRTALAGIMERLIEQNLQVLSTQRAEEELRAEKEAEEPKKEAEKKAEEKKEEKPEAKAGEGAEGETKEEAKEEAKKQPTETESKQEKPKQAKKPKKATKKEPKKEEDKPAEEKTGADGEKPPPEAPEEVNENKK